MWDVDRLLIRYTYAVHAILSSNHSITELIQALQESAVIIIQQIMKGTRNGINEYIATLNNKLFIGNLVGKCR